MKIDQIATAGWYYYPESEDKYESLIFIDAEGFVLFNVSHIKWDKIGIYFNKYDIRNSLDRDQDFLKAKNSNFRKFIRFLFNANYGE